MLQRIRDKNEILEVFIAAFKYLKPHPECNGKVDVVDLCVEGRICNMNVMTVKVPELLAAVPFYGEQPMDEEVPAIKASLL